MKWMLFALLAFGMLFANTPQESLDAYYTAFMQEDIDAFMDLVDASNATHSQLSSTREFTMLLWEKYDTDSYSLSGLECIEDWENALCRYSLRAEISGAETLSYDLDYIALIHKVSGQWKVSFAMPLDEYLETREEQEKLAIVDTMLDDEHDLYFKEPPGGVKHATFNGQPLQDLSNELDGMVYSCVTDEYCQQNGHGDYCQDGMCSGPMDSASVGGEWEDVDWGDISGDGAGAQQSREKDACGGTLAFLLLSLILFINKNK